MNVASCDIEVPVSFCLQVNAVSAIYVQIGCKLSPDDDDIVYRDAPAQTSWGQTLRTFRWIRNVPKDAYVRIRVCALPSSCTDVCDTPENQYGVPLGNKLVCAVVDGFDVTQSLQNMLDTQTYACLGARIGCQAPLVPDSSDCCHEGTTVLFTNLVDIPHGSEIVLGPLNSTFVVHCG